MKNVPQEGYLFMFWRTWPFELTGYVYVANPENADILKQAFPAPIIVVES